MVHCSTQHSTTDGSHHLIVSYRPSLQLCIPSNGQSLHPAKPPRPKHQMLLCPLTERPVAVLLHQMQQTLAVPLPPCPPTPQHNHLTLQILSTVPNLDPSRPCRLLQMLPCPLTPLAVAVLHQLQHWLWLLCFPRHPPNPPYPPNTSLQRCTYLVLCPLGIPPGLTASISCCLVSQHDRLWLCCCTNCHADWGCCAAGVQMLWLGWPGTGCCCCTCRTTATGVVEYVCTLHG